MILRIIIILLLTSPLWADSVYQYECKQNGKITNLSELEYKAESGYRETSENETILSEPVFLSTEYTHNEPEKKTVFKAVRIEKVIQVTGTLNGRAVNKTLNPGNKEWIQSWALAIKYAMTKNLDTYTFLSFRPDKLELMEFEIKKLDAESLTIDGNQILTRKYRVGLTGLLSALFGIDYWVRIPDDTMMRFKISDFESELISEKDL